MPAHSTPGTIESMLGPLALGPGPRLTSQPRPGLLLCQGAAALQVGSLLLFSISKKKA